MEKSEASHLSDVPELRNTTLNDASSIQVTDVEAEVHWRTLLVVFSSCLTYCASVSILIASGFWKGNVSADIGGEDVNLWLQQAINIVATVIGLPISAASDRYGRKWILVTCCASGFIGACIVASASSMNVAIVGSCFSGLAWGALGISSAIASEVIPRAHRGTAQLLFQGVGTFGNLIAAIGGGALVARDSAYPGWRILFWILAALTFTSTALFALVYNPPKHVPKEGDGTARMDYIGTGLWACGVVPFLMALVWGGSAYAWTSAHVLASIIVGSVFLVGFGLHQFYYNKEGLFNHQLFASRNFPIALVAIFVEGMVYIVYSNFIGQQSAILYDARPVQFGLRFCVFPLCALPGYVLYSYIVYKTKNVKWVMVWGFTLFMAGIGGLAACGPDKGSLAIGMAGLAGFGFAAPIALIGTVVQLAVPPAYIGLAGSLAYSMRALGGAIGVTIAEAIFKSKLTSNLPGRVAASALAAGLPATSLPTFVTGLATLNVPLAMSAPGVTPEIFAAGYAATLAAFSYSFRYVWIVTLPFIALATILVLLLHPVHSDMTATIDRPVERIDHAQHVEARASHT